MQRINIGVISDTHLAGDGKGLPAQVFQAFKNVDLILHCGDLECLGVLDELEKIAPVKAVRGYEDPTEIGDRLADRVRAIPISITGRSELRIGMVHDIQWPYPPIYTASDGQSIVLPENDYDTRILVTKKFGSPVDIVLFGDTHEELSIWSQNILWMNPGSPTFPGKNHESNTVGTVGLLYVDALHIQPCIINLREIDQ